MCVWHVLCDLRFIFTPFVMSCDVLPSIRHFQGGSAIEGAGDERRPAGEFPLGRGTAFDMFQAPR